MTTDGPGGGLVGADAAALGVAEEIRSVWDGAGLGGAFLAHDLDTGAEIGFAVAQPWPLASLVKLPLALVVLDAMERGDLDPSEQVLVDPASTTRGRTGLGAFAHPAQVALDDLVTSAMTVSDNAAADLLFARRPPATVSAALLAWGVDELVVRHRLRDVFAAAAAVADDARAALELAVRAATTGGGHEIAMLDIAQANVGSARSLVALLGRIWTDTISVPAVTARLRALMAGQLTSRRIAAELASDLITVSSKTGTFLHLRHEAAVVATDTGDRLAMVALTQSRVPALTSPEADLAIGSGARLALEAMRR